MLLNSLVLMNKNKLRSKDRLPCCLEAKNRYEQVELECLSAVNYRSDELFKSPLKAVAKLKALCPHCQLEVIKELNERP